MFVVGFASAAGAVILLMSFMGSFFFFAAVPHIFFWYFSLFYIIFKLYLKVDAHSFFLGFCFLSTFFVALASKCFFRSFVFAFGW